MRPHERHQLKNPGVAEEGQGHQREGARGDKRLWSGVWGAGAAMFRAGEEGRSVTLPCRSIRPPLPPNPPVPKRGIRGRGSRVDSRASSARASSSEQPSGVVPILAQANARSATYEAGPNWVMGAVSGLAEHPRLSSRQSRE
eukprot:scaffold4188_cov115-Isochrysis_galbana.AAC.4